MNAVPYHWLALDIETVAGRPDDAEAWMRRFWNPSPKWKPETIGTRYLEALQKKIERLALIDESPIVAIALRSDSELRCLHGMGLHAPRAVEGALVEGFGNEREMLAAFRGLLSRCSEETCLAGHNILAFDLPRLRAACLRHRLALPPVLANPDQPFFDTMREYTRRFSADADGMVSLGDACDRLGLPHHKNLVDGADVAALHARGEVDTIVKYALLDVILESELFLRMTGQLGE